MKFQSRSLVRLSVTALCAATIGSAVAAPIAFAQAPSASQGAGTVVSSEPLPKDLWIPGTADAKRFTYWTIGSNGQPALSSGAYYVPAGPAPEGGWPVIAWAHGTTGLDDSCAPSLVGPGLPDRDYPYLGRWLDEGYAIVATDYVGLGTPGLMPYLDGKVEAHSVVDSVKAARAIDSSISNRWAVVGQSQGGGAAITTARYATEYGGDSLDYRGGVGTGVPANIELAFQPAGPGFPPIALGGGLTSYALYILAGFREAHPEIDLNSYLTPLGRENVDLAEKLCAGDLEDASKKLVLGDLLSRPLNQIPNFYGLLNDYMGVPTSGYDRPIFIGQGLLDVDVPAPSALSLVAALVANREPVTFKTYNTDHSGAFVESQADTIPFVANLFR